MVEVTAVIAHLVSRLPGKRPRVPRRQPVMTKTVPADHVSHARSFHGGKDQARRHETMQARAPAAGLIHE